MQVEKNNHQFVHIISFIIKQYLWKLFFAVSQYKQTVMAEIQNNNSSHQSTKRKQLSTRVDLTPMVDLGFLLITFFIFTTTMSKPVAMNMLLPKDDRVHNTEVAQSKVINIIPINNNRVKYYFGDNIATLQETDYSENGIRKVLLEKRKEVKQKWGNENETIALIKPDTNSSYQNLVDIFDEMTINDITRYMLVDISDKEKAAISL